MPLVQTVASRTARKLRAPLGVVTALATFAMLIGAPTASAAPNPAANIPIGTLPAACSTAPTGATCTNAVVVALDAARADLGLGRYVLPADFDSLSGGQQLFILANLDRVAYGLPPINGLNPSLDSATQTAMRNDDDPNPTSLLGALQTYGWTGNWAGQWANAPYAYYEWMYDDGYDGSETSNLDCSSASASGCWVHRRNVLAFPSAATLSMGVSVGVDASGNSSYAMTLVWTTDTSWPSYDYTWTQAQAGGAASAAPAAAGASSTANTMRAAAPNTIIAADRILSTHRSARFTLRATGSASSFRCALVTNRAQKTSTPHFTACSSARAYADLASGRYTFYAQAVGAAGSDKTPASHSFKIR